MSCCNRPTYAVGDIHGGWLLGRLVETIRKDIEAEGLTTERPMIVFLGDYVDRGPARVLSSNLFWSWEGGRLEVRTLKGNHEQALLLFLEDAKFGPTWLAHGGPRLFRLTKSCLQTRAPAWRHSRRRGWHFEPHWDHYI